MKPRCHRHPMNSSSASKVFRMCSKLWELSSSVVKTWGHGEKHTHTHANDLVCRNSPPVHITSEIMKSHHPQEFSRTFYVFKMTKGSISKVPPHQTHWYLGMTTSWKTSSTQHGWPATSIHCSTLLSVSTILLAYCWLLLWLKLFSCYSYSYWLLLVLGYRPSFWLLLVYQPAYCTRHRGFWTLMASVCSPLHAVHRLSSASWKVVHNLFMVHAGQRC